MNCRTHEHRHFERTLRSTDTIPGPRLAEGRFSTRILLAPAPAAAPVCRGARAAGRVRAIVGTFARSGVVRNERFGRPKGGAREPERTRDGREERIEAERDEISGLAERREEPRRARRGNPGEAAAAQRGETRERRPSSLLSRRARARALSDLSRLSASRARGRPLYPPLARRRSARADRVSESTRGKRYATRAPCTRPREPRLSGGVAASYADIPRSKDRHASSCTRAAAGALPPTA